MKMIWYYGRSTFPDENEEAIRSLTFGPDTEHQMKLKSSKTIRYYFHDPQPSEHIHIIIRRQSINRILVSSRVLDEINIFDYAIILRCCPPDLHTCQPIASIKITSKSLHPFPWLHYIEDICSSISRNIPRHPFFLGDWSISQQSAGFLASIRDHHILSHDE